MQLSVKIYYAIPSSKERIPSIIAWNIIFMGFLSTLSFAVFNWNGVCIDVLGYSYVYYYYYYYLIIINKFRIQYFCFLIIVF